jgi:hypothetical protein
MAVTHDASPAGVMIVAANRLQVGAPVDLTFQIPPTGEREVAVRGTVVRVAENTADPYGMWPYRIAIEFDDPDPELEPVIDQLAQTHDPD